MNDKTFFHQPALNLTKQLLGAQLIHNTKEGKLAGGIVEVEAYLGEEDRAAHSFGGRRTKRTEVMFGPPGHAYLYIIYGIHVCLNVVAGEAGSPRAILIRAVRPTAGVEGMMKNRGINVPQDMNGDYKPNKLKQLTNGPGKLVKAFNIKMDLYGHDLTQPPLYIQPPDLPVEKNKIAAGPRIGIENTGEARSYPYRFWIKEDPFVSK